MRKLVTLALALGLAGMAAETATVAKKKSVAKKGPGPAVSARKTTATARTTASKRGKKGPARRAVTYRSRQLSPTPERYKEIQQALAAKGYLPAGQVSGKWDESSADALKKFQTDQNLDGSGKINSLSLIALGLGPKRDTTPAAKPAAPPAAPTITQ